MAALVFTLKASLVVLVCFRTCDGQVNPSVSKKKGTCATTQICYDPETSHMRADWSGINLGNMGGNGGGAAGPPGPKGEPGSFTMEELRKEIQSVLGVGGSAPQDGDSTADSSLEERVTRLEFTIRTLVAGNAPGAKPNIKPGPATIPPGAIDLYGWVSAPNGYQYLVTGKVKFDEAVKLCKSKGATLATAGVRDAATKQYLHDKLLSKRKVDVWVGLTDIDNEAEFYYLDGVKSTGFNTEWADGKPDGGKNKNCAYIARASGKLADYYCHFAERALCEL